jgi:hypothetical protein
MNPYIEAVSVLDKAFDFFNEKYCNSLLKKPLITIMSNGNSSCYGWHWANKWVHNGNSKTEIMLAAECMDRDIEDILETLIHEMVHLYNDQHDTPDCNAQQYHNRNFKNTAERVFFLEVRRMDYRGWAQTLLTEVSRADVREFCQKEKVVSLNLKRVPNEVSAAKTKQYMINVSEEDYEWFRYVRDLQSHTSKEFFKMLRETFCDAYTYEGSEQEEETAV